MSLIEAFARELLQSSKNSSTTLAGRCTYCYVSLKTCPEGGYTSSASCDSCVLEVCADCVQECTIFDANKKPIKTTLCKDCSEDVHRSKSTQAELVKTIQRRTSEKRKKNVNDGGRASRRRILHANDIFGPTSIDDPPAAVRTQIPGSSQESSAAQSSQEEDFVRPNSTLVPSQFFVVSMLGNGHGARSSIESPHFFEEDGNQGLQTQGLQMQSQNSATQLPPIESAFADALRRRATRTYANRRRRTQTTNH